MLKFLLAFSASSTISYQLMRIDKKYNEYKQSKQQIVLLGDGFLSRGFLDTIDKSRFKITQIYKDKFINPQDIIYQLNKNKWNSNPLHLRDIIRKTPDHIIQTKIRDMRYDENTIYINEMGNDLMCDVRIDYDHLVIGLGAQKSLKQWENEIHDMIDIKNLNIGVIGMGPTGIELATILSRNNNITLIDSLKKEDSLNYLSLINKQIVNTILEDKNILTLFNQYYNPNLHQFDKAIMCVGNRPNNLVENTIIDDKFRDIFFKNVYLGGDCANTKFPKNAQLAYAQGVYIANQINGKENRSFHYYESTDKPNLITKYNNNYYYNYKSNGMSLNIGDNKNLIIGHPYIPDGKYPCELLKLYSMFIV